MKTYNFYIISVLFLCGFILFGCSNDATTKPKGEKNNTEEKAERPINKPKQGGTITGAIYDAPTGMFNPIFSEDTYEENILEFTHESLFVQNEQLVYEAQLAKDNWELNEDQTKLTIHLEEGVTWHDGEPFTADDVVFTYQTIADPEYVQAGGIRSNYVTPLLGYEEYSDGETDEFLGVVAEDEYKVTFNFSKPNLTPEYYASFPIIPKHIFKDIPITDIPKADESREPGLVIGTGPFLFADMNEREHYTLESYEHYWQDSPYLEEIIWNVIEPSAIASLLKTGEIDFIANPSGIHPADYNLVNNLENTTTIEQTDFYFQMLGFKHNHRSSEDISEGVDDPKHWVPNDKLPEPVRKAIAYAIDRNALIGGGEEDGLLYGKGKTINAPVAEQSWAYDEDATIDYTYDPNKAEKILDKAGFKKADDGYRTDPDGGEWVLNMNYPVGNEIREQLAPLIKDYLEDIGININLRKPKDMSAFVSELTDDDTDWDLYLLGWNLNKYDPDPLGLWGIENVYNFSRWNNPESDKLLEQALETPDAFKQDYRAEIYADWQRLFSEDLPGLPLFAQSKLWTYNNRLQGVNPLPHTMYHDAHLWWVEDSD